MQRVTILIITLIIIGSLPLTAGRAIENPTQRDVFLHEYFSQVLTKFEDSLEYALTNESYSLSLANVTFQELNLLHQESLYYGGKGVNSTVMDVLPPFYEFSKQLVVLNKLITQFRATNDPGLAVGILGTAERMEALLDEIDAINLKNGTEVLVFDTSKVRERLEEVKAFAAKVPQTREFTLRVSNRKPIINETITIFGTCPHNETVTIIITDGSHTILIAAMSSNGFFSEEYRFEKPGVYEIYATQGGERSNSVNVTVEKIPTTFVVDETYSALINSTIELRGRLVDYYGRSLGGRNVSIGNTTVVTGADGGFSKEYFSKRAKTFKVALTFGGDEVHEGTSKVVTLVFRKYPVSIILNGPTEIVLGENATFKGTIKPPLDSPLWVYINGSLAFKVTPSNGTFSFTIAPKKPGSLRLHVEYPGSEFYEKASSNLIVLMVIPPQDIFVRYLAIGVLAVVLAATAVVARKRRKTRRERGEPSHQVSVLEEGSWGTEKHTQVPEDVGEAYKLLRAKLKEKFGVSESLTPREVLKALSRWELYPILERVTLLHEKAVYSAVALNEEEIREFREGVERLLRGEEG